MKILFHTPTGTTKPYPRSDDEPVVGLMPQFEIYDLIDPPAPEHDISTHYVRRLQEQIDVTAKTVTRGWEIVPRETPSIVVSSLNFFLAMDGEDEIRLKNYIATIKDAEQQRIARIYMARATDVSRTHPFVLQCAQILGKTPEQVDALFAKAQTL